MLAKFKFKKFISDWGGLTVALIAMCTILLVSFPSISVNDEELILSIAGQRVMAILVFAVIVWISEAVSYELSALMIISLLAILLGFSPDVNHPEVLYGTSQALGISLSGFSNSSLALVAEALFISAAMSITGLDRRIALHTLNLIGTTAKSVLLGSILVTILLSLLVPSATARCACMVPIMIGIIDAFKINRSSKFAAGIMICVAQATNIWNVGILTAAAQNVQTVGFISSQMGVDIAWMTWFLAGAPWAIIMSVVLFFLIRKLLPPEMEIIPGGKEVVKQQIADLGKMTRPEKTLMIVSLIMLVCWSLEGVPHIPNIISNITTKGSSLPNILKIDVATVTAIGFAFLLLPIVGVMQWKELQKRTSWGTLLVFAVGISLGGALITTEAGVWLAGVLVSSLGLAEMSMIAVFAILGGFLIVIHLGFASATAISGAMIPIMIPVAASLTNGDMESAAGLVMLLGFTVSYGMIMPINAPQSMLCLGTKAFTPGQYAKIGLPLTIIGFVLMLIFAKLYWPLLGLL